MLAASVGTRLHHRRVTVTVFVCHLTRIYTSCCTNFDYFQNKLSVSSVHVLSISDVLPRGTIIISMHNHIPLFSCIYNNLSLLDTSVTPLPVQSLFFFCIILYAFLYYFIIDLVSSYLCLRIFNFFLFSFFFVHII